MSVSKTIHLVCDWPGCSNEVNTGLGLLSRAREQAGETGWVSVAGVDLCGPAPDGSGDHARQAQASAHLPRVESAGYRRVHVSCSCGWAYEPAVDSVLVASRWRMHLDGAVMPPKTDLLSPTGRGGRR